MSQEKISFPSIKDVPESQWEELSKKRIYFGHQSVGKNIIEGIEDLKKKNPQIKLSIAETTSPMEVTQGILAHTGIGMNGDPKSKIQAFADFMDRGLETEAVNLILSKVKEGKFSLLVSSVHDVEIRAIDDAVERIKLQAVINEMGVRTKGDLRKMRARTEELVRLGFGAGDAAHLAFAEFHSAEFVTCDDRVIRKSLRHKIGVWCGNLVSFCEKEGLR